MELTKIPGPMRVIWGSIGAWWVGQQINPGFFSIALLMLCLIPVLVFELYFYEPKKVSLKSPSTPQQTPASEEPSSAENTE